jgi:hypothetical protein
MSDAEKSDQDLIVDDASEGPTSPMANGPTSPRLENGFDRTSMMAMPSSGVQTISKKDVAPHSPRSGTSSNASTSSAKKMDGEKATTSMSKSAIAAKSSASKLLQQSSSLPNSMPPTSAAYSTLHYSSPGAPQPHSLASSGTGQHPHIDVLGYNGYPAPKPSATLQQLYDPHATMRASTGSAGIAAGKP